MNKTAKILLGFTTGALAGIVTGLLLAPDRNSGKMKAVKKKKDGLKEGLPLFFEKTVEDFDYAEQENKK